MSGGSTTIQGQKPTKGNEETVKILLIVNITWVGGWEVIIKRGKGPSPKEGESHMKRKHKETSTDLCSKTYEELKSCKQRYIYFFVCVCVLARSGTSLSPGWEKLERTHVYGAWPICEQRRRSCRQRSSHPWSRLLQSSTRWIWPRCFQSYIHSANSLDAFVNILT